MRWDDDGSEEFDERFVRLSDRVERYIRKAIFWVAILLAVFQLALTNESLRRALSVVDALEGTPYVLEER